MSIAASIGSALRAPLLLGTRGIHGIAEGIQKVGKGDLAARSFDTYRELSDDVAKQLGQAGLAGRPTPPSYGRVAGIRFRQPPGSLSRGAGSARGDLAERLKWTQDLLAKDLSRAASSDTVKHLPGVLGQGAQDKTSPLEPRKAVNLDGKGNDILTEERSLGGRVASVGAMLDRVGEIMRATQEEIRRLAGPLRV